MFLKCPGGSSLDSGKPQLEEASGLGQQRALRKPELEPVGEPGGDCGDRPEAAQDLTPGFFAV